MHLTNPAEIFLLMLVSVCLIAVIAERLKISSSIAMVLGGICLALIPGFPEFQIPPEMILLIFLPVMLTEAAYFTSLRDFKRNIRPISRLAFGLVIFTAFMVAAVFQWMYPGAGWAGGFILGAIVSPPDAVAATSVIRSLRLPKRVVTILEGESLINDATGLVIYKFAVAAVLTGAFSLAGASLDFAWMVISGLAVGGIFAILFTKLFPHIKERSVEILSVFLLPYAAYIATEQLGGSGVLAVVTCGIITFWFSAKNFSSEFRLQSAPVWRMVIFVMNGLVFLLIGLYFPSLVARLSHIDPVIIWKTAGLVSFTVIATRFVWVFGAVYGIYWAGKYIFRQESDEPSWQNTFIIAWTGMRGVVTLATALALPLLMHNGERFPYRDLTIFLAFSVILFTLVLQGLPLPWIIKKLSLTYDPQVFYENWNARKQAAELAAQRLKEICERGTLNQAALERILSHYKDRITSLGDGPNTPLNQNEPDSKPHPIIEEENNIWQEVLQVERDAILGLRLKFEISDEVMHELLREVDLMETRFSHSAAA